MATSNIRMNFHETSEAAINKQINLELHASYVYMSMAYYFDREDVALVGFRKWCLSSSDEERGHAMKLMDYQNKRGGRIVLQNVSKPQKDSWGTALEAMEAAMALEKTVNTALIELHKLAANNDDGQMTDFVEGEFLKEQVESIKEIGTIITELKMVGEGLGVYLFDKHTMLTKSP